MNDKKSNSNLILWLVIIGFIVVVVFFNAAVGSNDRVATPRPTSRPVATTDTTRYILYKVEGNGRTASVTYENGDGNTEQADVEIPWRKGFTFAPGDFVYLSVQSGDQGSRSITCEIVMEGEVIETATSQGEYVIASCSGSVGDD